MEELIKNNIGLQILTDTGWSNFDGLIVKGQRQVAGLQLTNSYIKTTLDHDIYTNLLEKKSVKQLKVRDKIYTKTGIQSVVSIKLLNEETVYDLLNVKHHRRFFANDILCSNCEFIIDDETLIAATTLIDLEGREPIMRQGQIRWYKQPERGRTYVVALDPSLGTGGDPAAIQVLELPNCVQIAEWQHNRTPVTGQINILKEICGYINDTIKTENDIYYSVENNTLGEAALICINEIGEENIRGMFLSEPAKIGTSRRYRKGFTTTNKTKLAACAKLKTMVESKKLTLNSRNIISELKNYVAHAGSFAAKPGETDDLVSGMLLALRMTQVLQTFDPEIDNRLKDSFDELLAPMPFIMIS